MCRLRSAPSLTSHRTLEKTKPTSLKEETTEPGAADTPAVTPQLLQSPQSSPQTPRAQPPHDLPAEHSRMSEPSKPRDSTLLHFLTLGECDTQQCVIGT